MSEKRPASGRTDRLWATVIGAGLALYPIHNTVLTSLVTGDDGEVGFFLPAFGAAIWIMGALAFAINYWEELRWGERRIHIPLLIIVAAISLSGIVTPGVAEKVAPLFMGCSLFALYLVSRRLGKDIFLPLAVGAAVASLGVILAQLFGPVHVTGGWLFEDNYDIIVGYVLLGVACFAHRYQWILAGLALLAMLLTGSPEGVFSVAVLGLLVLARQDWGPKLVIVLVPVLLAAVLLVSFGQSLKLYGYVYEVIRGDPTVGHVQDIPEDSGSLSAIGYRVWVVRESMHDIRPLGHGYNITAFYEKIVHNVPLIIVQQLGWPGFLAGAAWLWVTVYCLIRTRRKYAWALVLSLSLWDHYTWTQLGPWWWTLVGISSSEELATDRIFTGPLRDRVRGRLARVCKVFNGGVPR